MEESTIQYTTKMQPLLKPRSQDQTRDLHTRHVGDTCPFGFTIKQDMTARHHNGKHIQYKPCWDQPVTIKKALCVQGGLCILSVSNLIAATRTSDAYNSLVLQNVMFALCMYVDTSTRLTASLIKNGRETGAAQE